MFYWKMRISLFTENMEARACDVHHLLLHCLKENHYLYFVSSVLTCVLVSGAWCLVTTEAPGSGHRLRLGQDSLSHSGSPGQCTLARAHGL